MLVLGFDSSTDRISAALLRFDGDACSGEVAGGGDIAASSDVAAARYSEVIIGLIDSLLKEAGATPRDLTGIAVGTGPGSFTGLRIGVATARTFAQALRLPLAGVPALSALTLQAHRAGMSGEIIAALDARRGDVYRARFQISQALVELEASGRITLGHSPPGLMPIPDFFGEVDEAPEGIHVIGTACDLLEKRDAEPPSGPGGRHAALSPEALRRPSGEATARLALCSLASSSWQELFAIEPLYWRPADALTLKERKAKGRAT